MSALPPEPVARLHDARIRSDVSAWQLEPPSWNQIITAKARFDLAAGRPAAVQATAPTLLGDLFFDPYDPMSTLLRPADIALPKARVDVVLQGWLYPPRRDALHGRAYLRFGPHVDKVILAVGPRRRRGASVDPPGPLTNPVPLRWELSAAGIHNPRGRGADHPFAPLLVDPENEERPCCTAAISPYWPTRRQAYGTFVEPRVVPVDHDSASRQAAPMDQRVDVVRGDESYRLEGFRPDALVLEGSLGGLHLYAWHRPSPASPWREAACRIDTVIFDTEAQTVDLVWRGRLGLGGGQLLLQLAPVDAKPDVEAVATQLGTAPLGAAPLGAAPLESERARVSHPPTLVQTYQSEATELAGRATLPVDSGATRRNLKIRPIIGIEDAASTGESGTFLDLEARAEAAEALERRLRIERWLATPGAERPSPEDFTATDLSHLDFRGRDLHQLLFRRSHLVGARFDQCDLRGAKFAAADASSASFRGAQLDHANFTATILTGAHFDQAQGREADFTAADAERASFARASLEGAVFDEAQLQQANFSHCLIQGGSFDESELREADLTEADVSRGLFADANLERARLVRAKLRYCDLGGATLHEADFSHCDLTGAKLEGAVTTGARFEGAVMP